jgi:hypothetical protein
MAQVEKPRNLRVEFEVDAATVEELIKTSGTPKAKRLSRADIRRMSEAGELRASDFLTPNANAAIQPIIFKLVGKAASKAANKASAKLSDPTVRAVAVTEVVDKGVDVVTVTSAPRRGARRKR